MVNLLNIMFINKTKKFKMQEKYCKIVLKLL